MKLQGGGLVSKLISHFQKKQMQKNPEAASKGSEKCLSF